MFLVYANKTDDNNHDDDDVFHTQKERIERKIHIENEMLICGRERFSIFIE
jgi:hypothetical protein